MDTDIKATVTPSMALYVHEALSRPSEDEGILVFRSLLLKMYGVWFVAKIVDDLHLDKEELWMLQPIAKLAGQVGTEKVGLAWFEIIHKGLLHLEAQAHIHAAVLLQGESPEQKESPKTQERMTTWKAKQGG